MTDTAPAPCTPTPSENTLSTTDGRFVPLTRARLRGRYRGGFGRVVLEQTFTNPYSDALDVTYRLPLPQDAAVSGFSFNIDGRKLNGEIDRKRAARDRYAQAIAAGHTAAHLEQKRSSVFSQEIGNVPPGARILVRIELDQRLVWVPNAVPGFAGWEWRFPTVVAPRYSGGHVQHAGRAKDRVRDVALELDLVVDRLERSAATSPSHALALDHNGHITLAERAGHDRDVVVRWAAATPNIALSLDLERADPRHVRADNLFGLLTIVPPSGTDTTAVPRELVLVFDTSGSMSGRPLAQARRVAMALIDSLCERDTFELIEFSSSQRRFAQTPVVADQANRARAQQWVASLQAGGCTQMVSGILAALSGTRARSQRQVVVLTDGLVGFENEVVAAVVASLPEMSRLHMVGIGSAVNRSLTAPAARAGRGCEIVIGLEQDAEQASARILARTQNPLVVNLVVEGSALLEHAPTRLPDLYGGSPSLISLRLAAVGGELRVHGQTATGTWQTRISVRPPGEASSCAGLAALFARERVEDLELSLAAGAVAKTVDRKIEAFGLEYSIATRMTSWVAVGERTGHGRDPAKRHQSIPQQIPYEMGVQRVEPEPALPGAVARRVRRNADGVIVAVRAASDGPKILGFLPLAPRVAPKVVITHAADAAPRGRASARKVRERRAVGYVKRRTSTGRPGAKPHCSAAPRKPEHKRLRIHNVIEVAELAHRIGQKVSALQRCLWSVGVRGARVGQPLDFATAELVAAKFDYTLENIAFQADAVTGMDLQRKEAGEPRAPVVTLLGHVDHGKTSLLDALRDTYVAENELGGITQQLGVYRVGVGDGEAVFVDTPGHAAFAAMRSGAVSLSDVIILVVAADAGVSETTLETIACARSANVPVVVAITKCDLHTACPQRVKASLMEAELVAEAFGGDTPIVEVSAKTGAGLGDLLELVHLQVELQDLRAAREGPAHGTVLDARMDVGKGPVATVLVRSGTLRVGDIVVANEVSGKVRGLWDLGEQSLEQAGPAEVVHVVGLPRVPCAGDEINVVATEKDAKDLIGHRCVQRQRRDSEAPRMKLREMLLRKRVPVLKVVLKADAWGPAQAARQMLEQLSTAKVRVEVLRAQVGEVCQGDLDFAQPAGAVVFGFNVAGKRHSVGAVGRGRGSVESFGTIYELEHRAKQLMAQRLPRELHEVDQGEAEVRALFPVPGTGIIAGCRVLKGSVLRTSHVRVIRGKTTVHEGNIGSLRVAKTDVHEVGNGFECGICVEDFSSLQLGDRIEAFTVTQVEGSIESL